MAFKKAYMGLQDMYENTDPWVRNTVLAGAVGTLGLGAYGLATSGNPQQVAVQATEATGQPNANEMAMVGDNVNLSLKRQVYGDPLNDMEALQQAAKMSKELYRFPERKEKAIRDAEIEGQLQALTAAALQQQYLN